MKLIITILLTLIASYLYGQYEDRPTKITLQQTKISIEIDSLLHVAIRQCDTTEKYFDLEIVESGNDFLFNVRQIPTSSTKIFFPPLKLDDYIFFNIDGYTVFVMRDKDPFHFFKRTRRWKSFLVGNPQKDIPNAHGSPYFGVFSYKNGKFQQESIVAY